jgi:hypothetical protein
MNRGEEGEPARRVAVRSATEAPLVLDHFVEGFEWKIPTRFTLRNAWQDPDLPERPRRLLVYAIEHPAARVRTGPGLLEGFLKLETARDEAILAFARRWGPLWLCSHDLPYGHSGTCEPYFDKDLQYEMEDDGEDEEGAEDDSSELTLDELLRLSPEERFEAEAEDYGATWYGEELSAWRELSRQMRATMRIARRLQDGQKPEIADWDVLPFLTDALLRLVVPDFGETWNPANRFVNLHALKGELAAHGLPTEGVMPGVSDLSRAADPYAYLVHAVGRLRLAESTEFRRRALSEVLNYWLRLGGVRPRYEWTGRRPQILLGGHALMGALAVQMLFDCSRTDGLAVCAGCGTPFLPGPRRPRRDRNTYCSDCGTRAAARDAAARYRQTQKYRATYTKWAEGRRPT